MSDQQPPHNPRGWSQWWSTPMPMGTMTPDTPTSALPPTQGSAAPGGYRPYPVDMQNAADGQFGWTPEYGSTQPPSSQRHERNINVDDLPEINVRTPYSPGETDKLFEVYVAISEDPIVGTNQSGKRFWDRIVDIYNEKRPDGTIERNASMLRNAFNRASEEIQKFQGFYLEEMRTAGSGTSEADIMTGAMLAFQSLQHKPFRHITTWKMVRHLPKWAGGTQSSSGSTSKRSRSHTDVGEDEVASQLAGAHLDSSDAAPSGSRRRPQGTKAAKASRRRGQSQAQAAPVGPPPPIPPNPNTLFGYLQTALNTDTSRMNPQQLFVHGQMIEALQVQLGIPVVRPPQPPNE